MQHKTDTYDVGVIVGRFQVPELHDAHRDLIQTVCDHHDKVIIFLGLSPVLGTRENPLDFESRKKMLLEEFPEVNVLYIKDIGDDATWSRKLDSMIGDLTTPAQSVVLYGGRDSFIDRYSGRHATQELVQDSYLNSGTTVRREVARSSAKGSDDFRRGVVWAAYNRFPTCFPTVDIAIFNEDGTKILLGRKEHEPLYRLIGGFADPGSPTYEADARREVQEEAGIAITDPQYVTSMQIDDWRYRNEVDKIKTLLFRAKHLSGRPTPGDDIFEVRWFDWTRDLLDQVMPTHRPLIEALRTHNKSPLMRS